MEDLKELQKRVMLLERLCHEQLIYIEQLVLDKSKGHKGSIQREIVDKAAASAHIYLYKGVPFPMSIVNDLEKWKNEILH